MSDIKIQHIDADPAISGIGKPRLQPNTDTSTANPIQSRLDELPLSMIHYKIWFVCSLGFILDSMDLYLISYALPLIINEWQISPANIGIIASGAMWGMMIGAWVWGILADRIGRRSSMQAVVGIFSVFTGLCALAWNTLTLFFGRFIVGLGLGGLNPVDYAVQAEFIPSKYRGRMMAGSVVLWPLGGFLGAFIALNVAPLWGWKALFVIGALPAVLIFLVRYFVPESPRFLLSKGRMEEALNVVQWLEKQSGIESKLSLADVENTKYAAPKQSSIKDLFVGACLPKTLLTSFIWFAHCLPYYGILLWLPTLMTKYYHIPQATTFQYMMIFTAVGIVGRFAGMSLVDSWGRKPVMISFGLGTAAGLLAYNWISSGDQLVWVASFAAFFYEGIWAGMVPYTAELFPTEIRATGSGFVTGVGRIAAAMAPMLIGFAVEFSLSAIFYALAGMELLLVIGIIALVLETKGKRLEEI